MRILTTVLSLCVLAVLVNCGTADVGFNIGKVVPLDLPVELEGINDSKLPVQGLINPPAYSPPSQTFNLSDITVDDSGNIDVVINGLAYKIEGVETGEDFKMDEFTIQVMDGITPILDLTIFSGGQSIANQAKINAAGFNSAALTAALEANRTITVSTVVDFAEIPAPIDFTFTFYFDVTAKVRQ